MPVGRITCSATCSECSSSYGPGVAETKITWLRWSSNSAKSSGRLSSAEGSRKPKSTSVCLRRMSPKYIPRTCGMAMCDSSMKTSQSSGK